MKKIKSPIYFRYEFSDETGRPEGGDIFEFSSFAKVQAMVDEILQVAHSDQVTVNLTVGIEKPFFGFLKHGGLSRTDAEKEMVGPEIGAMPTSVPKKTTQKKSSKKAAIKKTTTAKKPKSKAKK